MVHIQNLRFFFFLFCEKKTEVFFFFKAAAKFRQTNPKYFVTKENEGNTNKNGTSGGALSGSGNMEVY